MATLELPALLSSAAALRQALAGFDPGLLPGAGCAEAAEQLAATAKACAGAAVLAAARALAEGAHRERGFSDGRAWLARHSGQTGGAARRALRTAELLGACPATTAALLAGEVSLEEAGEVARAEEEVPGGEEELLGLARTGGLAKLREAVRERTAAAAGPDELHRRQQAGRHFRHWQDRLGMVCFSGSLPPGDGVPLAKRVEEEAARRSRAARAAGGEEEPFEAHAADALAALVAGSAGRSNRADLVVVVDLWAWRRGFAHPGEPAHVLGGGPLPVRLALELCRDAFVKAVLVDGVEVRAVKHFGRHLGAELRTALDLGPPPRFAGAACAECGGRFGLEYDHVDPVANGGPTSYDNLQPLCWRHHRDKTERDRRAGLLGRSPP